VITPFAGLVEEEERLEGGAKGLAALRLLLASLAIGVTLTLAAARGTEGFARLFGFHPVYTVAVLACAVDVIYLFIFRRLRGSPRRIAVLTAAGLAADIIMTGALIFLTGGYASPFLPLLFVWVIAAGTVLSGQAAFVAAALAIVCLSACLMLRRFDHPEDLWRAGAFHLAQSGALFIVAYLAGELSRRLAAARLLADEVLASLNEGLVVLDGLGRISFSNLEAERLLGLGLTHGDPLRRALAGQRLTPVRALLLEAEERFGPERMVLAAPEGGQPVEIAVSGTVVRDARGSFRGLIAVISDRAAERALEEAVRLAEQRRRVGELAMSIAHEIRNPLAAIRSAAQEVGREKNISPTGRELAEVVISESDRLDRIVSDFLGFARPRPPLFAPVDLRELAAEALALAGRSGGGDQRVAFANEVPAGALGLADADQLRQALLNLLLNGIEATGGAGRVRVGARPLSLGQFLSGMTPAARAHLAGKAELGEVAERRGFVLEVVDNGAGMDEETLLRAGEPFFTTRPNGTGLGLAIVERIAAAHNGAVNITSSPGRGTSVQLWLDAAEEKKEHAG
jgi:two-component system sensor histidine kinase PilS (NtrC family)